MELSDWGNVTMSNMIKILMGKVDNVQEQIGKVSREMGSLRIKKKY